MELILPYGPHVFGVIIVLMGTLDINISVPAKAMRDVGRGPSVSRITRDSVDVEHPTRREADVIHKQDGGKPA